MSTVWVAFSADADRFEQIFLEVLNLASPQAVHGGMLDWIRLASVEACLWGGGGVGGLDPSGRLRRS